MMCFRKNLDNEANGQLLTTLKAEKEELEEALHREDSKQYI